MKAKNVRLLVLAAVCAVALWTPAPARAWDACPSAYCGDWRYTCNLNGGTFNQTQDNYCELPSGNNTTYWNGVCTYSWRGPWTIQCYGI
jgi:hypothetical protein